MSDQRNDAAGELPLPDDPFGVLRRVLSPRARPRPGEVCEMCAEPIGEPHSHVAALASRRLMCSCRACYLLFTERGSGGQRMQAVPERYLQLSDFAYSEAQWDDLAIPVDLAFLFEQTDQQAAGETHIVACYPSPAGATESELDLSAWSPIVAANPALAEMEPDVEAVLVRRTGPGEFTCVIVPIDACYELVGIVRQHWTGFQGGREVWSRIDAFFAELVRKGTPRVRRAAS
jgi:Family of unknown function (DUF5947)